MPVTAQFITPCAPVAAKVMPDGPGYIAQPKLDGWRCLIVKNGRDVRFYSRNGKDLTPRLPVHMELIASMRPRCLILDCELVALAENGAVDFYRLTHMLRRHPDRIHLYAFDILRHNDTDMRPLPLQKRLARMASVVSRADLQHLHAIEHTEDLTSLFRACQTLGFEGIVIKRHDRPYVSGRCTDWQKLKTPRWIEANRGRWRHFTKSATA